MKNFYRTWLQYTNSSPGLFGLLLFCLLFPFEARAVDDIRVSISHETVEAKISPYMVGLHFIYTKAKDGIYEDGRVDDWAKSVGIGVARFPGGGVLKGWHWPDPSGLNKVDPWSPKYSGEKAPGFEWMSLDEYLRFVAHSGVKPLIGVDYLSGLKYGRHGESVQRAADLVGYLKDAGFPGAFYYIGNEDIHPAGGIEKAAAAFVDHAKAMKAADPTVKIFWNDNAGSPKRREQYLASAGEWADGVEFHGKWPYGAGWSKKVFTVRDWQEQQPIQDARRGVYSEKIKSLRKAASKAGYSELLFANNEYGLHANKNRFADFSRYTKSLVAIDFLIDLIVGGYDMTAFWANVDNEKSLMDKRYAYRMNPVHIGLGMLAQVQGGSMLKYKLRGQRVNGFVSKDGDGDLLIVLLNKDKKKRKVALTLKPDVPGGVTGQMTVMQDTRDHWGEMMVSKVGHVGKKLSIPPFSLALIKLQLD